MKDTPNFFEQLCDAIAERVVQRLAASAPPAPPPQAPPQPAQYVTTKQAAAFLGLGRSTLENFRTHGKGPKWIKVGAAVRYARADLEAWAAAHAKGPKK